MCLQILTSLIAEEIILITLHLIAENISELRLKKIRYHEGNITPPAFKTRHRVFFSLPIIEVEVKLLSF